MKVTSQMRSLTCLMPIFLTGKDLAEIDLASVEADAPASGDGYGLLMEGIVEIRQAFMGRGEAV